MYSAATLQTAVAHLREGGLIAYPTEAVWGLGCDPDDPTALAQLLALKQRDPTKGLILIAASMAHLEPWLAGLEASLRQRLADSWPGPLTWLVPDNGRSLALLRGDHDRVALRVSDHSGVIALCDAFGGPLVSTSANRAGDAPARDATGVRACFGDAVAILDGPLGDHPRPSRIRDLRSGEWLRE